MPMRWWACVIVAVVNLCLAGVAGAAVTGRVASIGFQSYIRLEDWTPIVVQVTSDEPAPHTYDLQIVQTDLDGDDVIYTRAGIVVNPGTYTFRTYFRPETANGGLPVSGADDGGLFAKRLRVYLYDPATKKRAVRLSVAGATPQAMEHGSLSDRIGQKLILVVGRSPSTQELSPMPGGERVLGLAERTYFIQTDPTRLPESSLAYGAVDAVVWTDADASRLTAGQTQALRHYVRTGGTLAVVQTADTSRQAAFADLLPVNVGGIEEWDSRSPLNEILLRPGLPPLNADGRPIDIWRSSPPPYRMADAKAVDDTTLVDTWVKWPDGHSSPFIARRLFGLGCVAWIAEDISDPVFTGVNHGWPRVWSRLFDWRNNELVFRNEEGENRIKSVEARYEAEGSRDLGRSFVEGMNPDSRTYALLSLTFVFFIVYWVLVGPASYVVLAARKRTQLSWLVFGVVATAATLITVGIAQLVLGGDATVKHVSLVRTRPGGEPARILSRVGVYLPKDVTAPLALPQGEGLPPTAVGPFETDPDYARDNVTPRDSPYAVDVAADTDARQVTVNVPFRSTLKKIQADYSGTASGIVGRPRIADDARSAGGDRPPPVEGQLANDSGHTLNDVLLIFRSPYEAAGDQAIWLPQWPKGQTVDLASLWKSATSQIDSLGSGNSGLKLGGNKPVRGPWTLMLAYLQEDLRRGITTSAAWDDHDRGYARSFPLVSLYGRSPAMINVGKDKSRVDLTRRGVRQWDVSPAVAAGAMVVLAQTDGPLPVPLTVDGETPDGTGRLFFQSVLPVDRGAFQAPSTQPAD